MYLTDQDKDRMRRQIAGIKDDLSILIKNPDTYSSITTALRDMSFTLSEAKTVRYCKECKYKLEIVCQICGADQDE